MHNEKTKTKFLSTLPTAGMKIMFASLFNRTEHFESATGKDILRFNVAECTNLITHLSPKSVKQTGVLRSQFSKYVEWGLQNGMADRNYWLIIANDEDQARAEFAKRYVKDIEALQEIVNAGLSARYDKYVIYLLFMGIMGEKCEELSKVEDSDVSVARRTVATPRRTFHMGDALYGAITEEDFVVEKKSRNEGSPYFVKPYNTKKTKDSPVSHQHVNRVVRRLNKGYNEICQESGRLEGQIELVPMTIWRSGLFSALHEIEKIKGGLVVDDFKFVSEVYGNRNTLCAYQRDYELYKEIFWGS